MKHKQKKSSQFDNIVEGVLFHDFLFELTLQAGADQDNTFLFVFENMPEHAFH